MDVSPGGERGGDSDVEVAARDGKPAHRQRTSLLHDSGSGTFLMTAQDHTIYTIGLFLALLSLWQWSKRRRRVSRMVTRAVKSISRETAG
jgi:hypothetical protein